MASDGSFANSGTLTAHATGAFTSNGQLSAGTAISAAAGTIDFSGGQTRSNGNISLAATAGNIAHRGGTLTAVGDVTLSAVGTLDNSANGAIQSGGTLALSTGASYTHNSDSTLRGNAGIRLSSGGDLTLAAGLNTPGTLQLAAAGTLTNNAAQVGHDVVLSAATLNNQGSFSAYNDLTATVSGQLTNASGKFFYAAHNLNLYANSLYNDEDGVLYAGHDLNIQKNAAGVAAASVTNHLGTLQAANDLTLRADSLKNDGNNPAVTSSTTTDSLPHPIFACSGNGLAYGMCYTNGEKTAAGETIYYFAYPLTRQLTISELQAFYDRYPDAPRGSPDLVRNYSNDATITTFAQWITATFPQLMDYRDAWRIDVTQTAQTLVQGAVGKPGQLVAGRDFTFTGGSLNNAASQIYAVRDVNLTGTAVTNENLTLQASTAYTTGRYFNGEVENPTYSFIPITTSSTTTTTVTTSTITAGVALTGSASAGVTNANAPAPTTVAPPPPTIATPSATPPLTPSTPEALVPANTPAPAYTIERNPKYLDLSQFFVTPSTNVPGAGTTPAPTPDIDWQGTNKRQDDLALSRDRLLDTVFTLNGRRGFENTQDSETRYRAYMNAAYATEERFDFENGIALTSEAIAQLTRDVVWQDRAPRDVVEKPKTNAPQSPVQTREIALLRLMPIDLTRDGVLRAAAPIELMTPNLTPAGRRDTSNLVSPGRGIPTIPAADPDAAGAPTTRHGIVFGASAPAPSEPH